MVIRHLRGADEAALTEVGVNMGRREAPVAHGASRHGRELDPAAKDLASEGTACPQRLSKGDDHCRIQWVGEDAGIQAGLNAPAVNQIPCSREGMDDLMTRSISPRVHHRDGPTRGQSRAVVWRGEIRRLPLKALSIASRSCLLNEESSVRDENDAVE